MNISIGISRKSVFGITEGISVTIAQHNGGKPTFDELWASDNEAPKLDIYYREAIGDLERALQRWLVSSTGQFNLQAVGDDYNLKLKVSDSWPGKLTGLLENKIQDYLVHCLTEGWLNDFPVQVKRDYTALAVHDISDITYILSLKDLAFKEYVRAMDDAETEERNTHGTLAGRNGRDNAAVCVQQDYTDWSGVPRFVKYRKEYHGKENEQESDSADL